MSFSNKSITPRCLMCKSDTFKGGWVLGGTYFKNTLPWLARLKSYKNWFFILSCDTKWVSHTQKLNKEDVHFKKQNAHIFNITSKYTRKKFHRSLYMYLTYCTAMIQRQFGIVLYINLLSALHLGKALLSWDNVILVDMCLILIFLWNSIVKTLFGFF